MHTAILTVEEASMEVGPPECGWAPGTTSTQIGKAIEALVACTLMLASKGRLTPFVPVADDDGLDLLLFDKLTGRTIPVQVKGRTGVDASGHGTVQFDVRKKTFTTRYGSFLLAVLVDVEAVKIGQSWLIPMEKLAGVSSDKGGVLAICPNTSPVSKDRYRSYRYETVPELVAKLIGLLDARVGALVG